MPCKEGWLKRRDKSPNKPMLLVVVDAQFASYRNWYQNYQLSCVLSYKSSYELSFKLSFRPANQVQNHDQSLD